MDDSIDSIYVQVDLQQEICYLDKEEEQALNQTRYEELNSLAVGCSLSDYIKCRSNLLDSCKFVDCYTTKTIKKAQQVDSEKDYLFSACVPKAFEDIEVLNVCKDVANGNYYIDYFLSDDGGALDEWGGKQIHTFLIIVIIISVILCGLCSLSCFYNYRVFRTHEPPFPVPSFCPDCLFP